MLRARLADLARVRLGSDLGEAVAEAFDGAKVGALSALLDDEAAEADGPDEEHDYEIDHARTPFFLGGFKAGWSGASWIPAWAQCRSGSG
jgi:hypothetical protein